METTTFRLEKLKDADTGEKVRQLLEGSPGVKRVLVRQERGEVYVKHSAAQAPRHQLLERLEGEGYRARVKRR